MNCLQDMHNCLRKIGLRYSILVSVGYGNQGNNSFYEFMRNISISQH